MRVDRAPRIEGAAAGDIAGPRTRQLIGVLTGVLSSIVAVSVLVRAVIEPALLAGDLPVAGLALLSFATIFWVNRTRFHQVAAFAFCFTPVWLNLVEGLRRPDGPVWYGLLPMAAILGAAFLRFRTALVLAVMSVAAAIVVVVVRAHVIGAETGTLIVMYVALLNAAALGMAVFRERVEAARRVEVERLAGQLAATERLESIGRLAGGIAHDFNNLLTVILSSVEFAREGDPEALDDVKAAGERAAGLTRQLLAFSSHRGGQRGSVAVHDAITAIRPLLRRLLPENIELTFQLGARASVLLEDQQLEQILFNLSANARDAIKNSGRLTIKTALESVPAHAPPPRLAGDFVVIDVVDTGAGMDAETRRHMLEPFFTTKPIGQGTGLGLATVHGIVKRAGGWMEVESAVGKGTCVRLALPTASAQSAPVLTPAFVKRTLAGRVLLVEDEVVVRRTTCRLLEGAGLTVLTAAGPNEVAAVMAASPGALSLLITDLVMPGGSGVELAVTLRAHQPTLPVLLISGYADEDLQGLLAQPATRFLAKPFSRDDLVQAIAALLDFTDAAPSAVESA